MLIIAHRGCSYETYNQNTIRSFQKVIDEGCNAFEFDVQKTKDNHLIIVHNLELTEVSTGQGLVNTSTLEYIEQIDAGNPLKHKDKIPLLEEVFELCSAYPHLTMHLELKGKDTALPASKIIKKWIQTKKLTLENFLISSFDFYELGVIQHELPNAHIALLSGSIIKEDICQKIPYDKDIFSQLFSYPEENFMLPKLSSVKEYEKFFQHVTFKNKDHLLSIIKDTMNGVCYNDELINLAKKTGAYSINVWHKNVQQDFIKKVHDNGMKIYAYTVNEKEDILKARDMGVDGIFTDFYSDAYELLKEK